MPAGPGRKHRAPWLSNISVMPLVLFTPGRARQIGRRDSARLVASGDSVLPDVQSGDEVSFRKASIQRFDGLSCSARVLAFILDSLVNRFD